MRKESLRLLNMVDEMRMEGKSFAEVEKWLRENCSSNFPIKGLLRGVKPVYKPRPIPTTRSSHTTQGLNIVTIKIENDLDNRYDVFGEIATVDLTAGASVAEWIGIVPGVEALQAKHVDDLLQDEVFKEQLHKCIDDLVSAMHETLVAKLKEAWISDYGKGR